MKNFKTIQNLEFEIELDPKSADLKKKGDFFRDQGQFANAVFEYNKAIRINPNFSNAIFNRAICQQEQKNLKMRSLIIKGQYS